MIHRFFTKTIILPAVFLLLLAGSGGGIYLMWQQRVTGAPPYGEPENAVPDLDPYAWLREWQRPDGPPKVGLQVGHWKNAELPEELSRLHGNTGASGGGKTEAEVNLAIAEEVAAVLVAEGVEVSILPATVPPRFWADAFVAIHADGSTDYRTSGYKVAAPWRDFSGGAARLVELLEEEYAVTGLPKDPNITRNMRGYYAFSWWRYEHAIHLMTPAAIVETGFLTNPSDRELIVAAPEKSAAPIAQAVLRFLAAQGLR